MKILSQLLISAALLASIISQAFGSVDFLGRPDYATFEYCVLDALDNRFDYGPLNPTLDFTDCDTEMCLCKPEALQKNLPVYYTMASSICVERGGDGRAGGQQATSIINAYCNEKGYTSRIGAATTLATTTAKSNPTLTTDFSVTQEATKTSQRPESEPAPTNTPRPPKEDRQLNRGEQAAIAVGGIIATLLVGLLGWWVARRYSRR